VHVTAEWDPGVPPDPQTAARSPRRPDPQAPPQPGAPPQETQPDIPSQGRYAEHSGLPPAPPGNGPPPGRRLTSHAAIGFIPWILFWVIGGPSTWETASIAALIAAFLVTAASLDFRPLVAASAPQAGQPAPRPGWRAELAHLKLLDVATVVFFLAMTIAAIVSSRSDVATLDKYSQAISSGALGLIALGSILAGHPFTVDYAKEQAPPQVWHTALFKRINLVLTSAWTVVFLVCAGLGLAAEQTSVKGWRDWLNWYIPIVLIFLAFRFTSWYPAQVRAQQQQAQQAQLSR
jgi:hypothetical protein